MIEVRNLSLRQGAFALTDLSFTVPAGRYCVFMGRTGSGKTTLLEVLCGLRPISAGTIHIGTTEVTQLAPGQRGIGYVPQDAALFPTMNVRAHLAFALVVRRWPIARIQARVAELAALLGIEPLLERFPEKLSGGEKQRVALGRALAFHPTTLLLDEPLSALDDETRNQMYELLNRVRQYTGVTTLHITHSRVEADQLADLILRLEGNQITTQVLAR
ncbi:MAG: ABC transporter ATP-binding protein [Phycisphaerae bacterium]